MQTTSPETSAVHKQLEAFAAQTSSLVQQLFNSQLLLNNQFLKNADPSQAPAPTADTAQPLLKAWGNAQDEWLKVTRNWIDTVNKAKG